MVRLFPYVDVEFGINIQIASLNWKQAEEHVAATRILIERGSAVKPDEWTDRTLVAVAQSLTNAGHSDIETAAKVREQFDIPTVNAIYKRVMEVSGLAVPAGEVAATAKA